MRYIILSKDLKLPLDIAGEAVGLLATRGAGKSYTSAVLVEELYDARVQLAVLDPTGVYWGLRASADGKGEGLPVIVLGGAHGDVPLEPTAGALIADLLIDTGQSIIMDLSDFPSKGAQIRFVTDFAERLYRRKARARTTLHLIIDEAHEFAPQKPMRDETRMLGAMEHLIRGGRSRGIGATLITQRSAALNKNVLDLVDTMFAMRVLSPRDRAAVESWISHKYLDDETGVIESLPGLSTGTAWVWSPVRGLLKKVAIRRIRTFDSYATPKPGQTKAEPKKLTSIDIGKLGEQIKATAERAKENDPQALKARIRELETALTKKPDIQPVLTDKQIKKLESLYGNIVKEAERHGNAMSMFWEKMDELNSAILEAVQSVAGMKQQNEAPVVQIHAGAAPIRAASEPSVDGKNDTLPRGELAALTVCGQYHNQGATREQITILTGYKRSTRDAYIKRLRDKGCIEIKGDRIIITKAGIDALGNGFDPLPGRAALREYWLLNLPSGEATIFKLLIDAYPDSVNRDRLSESTGYARSSRDAYIQRLKVRMLVVTSMKTVCANNILFENRR